MVFCWKLRNRSRGPLAVALLFAGILSPALGFLNVYPFVYSYVADHFQYLASIAIITAASTGITLLLDKFLAKSKPITRYAIPSAVLVLLALLTWHQAIMYRDAETLYLTTLRRNPDCWLAHNNLCSIFIAKGETDKAFRHAEEAVRLQPEDVEPQVAIGDVLLRKRLSSEAIAHYKKALTIRPDYAEVYSHLGSAYLLSERYSEAITQYRKTLSLAPQSLAAHNNLAWLLATCSDGSLRNGEEAVTLAGQANQLSGGNSPLILHTLAAAYAETGQTVRAIETARRAEQLAVAHGYQGLASMLKNQIGQYESRL